MKTNPADQKLDLLIKQVNKLSVGQALMQKDISNIKSGVSTLKSDVKKIKVEVSDLIETSSKSLFLAAQAKDRLDKIESHLATQSGFTPFTSGAFVA